MSTEEPEQPPGLPPGGLSFGGALASGVDTQLGAQSPADRLLLPRGALVVLRKSGGQRFSTREITVYRNGVMLYQVLAQGSGEHHGTGHLSDTEMARLDSLLRRAQLLRQSGSNPTNPDDFSYQLVARVGKRVRTCEFSGVNRSKPRERLVNFLLDRLPS
jgi:hypothetical protein